MGTRIQKLLARAGFGSRRFCEELVRAERVHINGEVVTLGTVVEDSEVAQLSVDGQALVQPRSPRIVLLNKPSGYVTTVSDPQGRKTVMDLLPPEVVRGPQRLFPVGRLDRDTEGLLLFTNDGDLAYRLLHPSAEVEKEYRAKVSGAADLEEPMQELRRGPELGDGPTSPPVKVWFKHGWLHLIIKEGRKRQVRRMLEAVGLRCLYLERLEFAGLNLRGLVRGEHRDLTEAEMRALRAKVAQEDDN